MRRACAWLIALAAASVPAMSVEHPLSVPAVSAGLPALLAATVQEQEALETRIQAAAQIAHAIWRLERLHSAIEQMHFEAGDGSDPGAASRRLNAALRSDQQMGIDTYTKLVSEIAAFPDALTVSAAMRAAETEFIDNQHPAMKIMLQTLAGHIEEARRGNIPTRDQMLDDIVTHTAKPR